MRRSPKSELCLGGPGWAGCWLVLTRSGVRELEAGAGLWRLSSAPDPAPECESDCVSEAVFIEVWPDSRPESSPGLSFRLWTRLVTVSFCNKSATTKKRGNERAGGPVDMYKTFDDYLTIC